MRSLLRKEEKFRKHINALSNWKEYCLEAEYSHYNGCDIPYLPPIYYDFCTILVSSVTITNAIRTLISYDYIEINTFLYIVGNSVADRINFNEVVID
jgi:hypothetical protein